MKDDDVFCIINDINGTFYDDDFEGELDRIMEHYSINVEKYLKMQSSFFKSYKISNLLKKDYRNKLIEKFID